MNEGREPEATGQAAAAGPFTRLGADLDNLLRSFVPSEEVCEHFTNARVEILKGVRAMIDARIERLSGEGRKGMSVTIE